MKISFNENNFFELNELKIDLTKALTLLTAREEKVLRLRFGLDDGRDRTLEEIGHEFNVTLERIRQIEAKALRKLRFYLKEWGANTQITPLLTIESKKWLSEMEAKHPTFQIKTHEGRLLYSTSYSWEEEKWDVVPFTYIKTSY